MRVSMTAASLKRTCERSVGDDDCSLRAHLPMRCLKFKRNEGRGLRIVRCVRHCCQESNSKKEAPLKRASSRKCNDSKELQVERSNKIRTENVTEQFSLLG
jgi:hypothetical protein